MEKLPQLQEAPTEYPEEPANEHVECALCNEGYYADEDEGAFIAMYDTKAKKHYREFHCTYCIKQELETNYAGYEINLTIRKNK